MQMTPYQTRPIRFLDLWQLDGWQLKAYAICYSGSAVSPSLIDKAYQLAAERLQLSAQHTNHYGVGFVGVHEGATGNFIFIDWWADENELHHHVYVAPREQPLALHYATPDGLAACVWDQYLIGHERDAWVRHVLKPAESDIEAYLQTRLNADV